MSHKRSRAAYEQGQSAAPPQHAPFAVYGTPLPAYDSDARDDGSYVPVWKQEVTDEHGRKRLHGAFTGGWSAGYFNTVGSKEGWAPATFTSSRADRAKDRTDGNKTQALRAEDFMDEEDLAAQADAQKLETRNVFAGLGSAEAAEQGGMFADLFRTTGETMGVKLLQKMGWRQGQGVGPKVRRRAEGDAKGEVHSFAPESSRMISFDRKTDRRGIGAISTDRLESDGKSALKDEGGDNERDARILQSGRSKPLGKLKKSGFGVGVLNDTGSDDEDAYAMGPQISYNRIIGADKKKKAGLTASDASPSVRKPIFTSSKKLAQRTAATAGFRKCHDGRLPLDAFVLSMESLHITEESKYPPPTIPEGWRSSKACGNPGDGNIPHQSTADAAKASTHDPKSRAVLLGEQQLPGKSVFDFLSPAVRDRLATASGKSNLPPALGEGAPAGFEASEAEKRRTLWDLIPPLDKQIASAALQRGVGGWMPYAEDSDKRMRYRSFLELRAGLQSSLPSRPNGFSIEEWTRELGEFAQAAEVFRPISGLMASRFTSSSSAPKLASDTAEPSTSANQKEKDPAEKAAKMGMYGPLTRSSQPFFPTRLVCKRFNVKPPANVAGDSGGTGEADSGVAGANKRLDVVSQASLERMMREANFKPATFVSGGVEGGKNDAAPSGRAMVKEVNVEKNDALEGPRAGEAVFKAIFGSDDEDD